MITTTNVTQNRFPTLDSLGAKLVEPLDAPNIAAQWFTPFAQALQTADVRAATALLLPGAFWRDLLALTWDFRAFYADAIPVFLRDRLHGSQISHVTLDETSVKLQQPYPDVAWIHVSFTFCTAVGACSGIVRLMPTVSGAWLAYTVFTNLEDLLGHPERPREILQRKDTDEQPSVVIIGAGHSGLEVAARLKHLGVKALVIEKEARVGHLWQARYESLCLHNTIWTNHMPYLPFPSDWPAFTPASQIAKWLEHYATELGLNIWTSTKLLSSKQDPGTHKWSIELERGDGSRHTLAVNHIVGAIGIGGGRIQTPDIPGMDKYQGKILHADEFKSAQGYIGKKVVVVGACTSAHDICRDFCDHGVDITMIQRSSTYVMSVEHGVKMVLGPFYNENSNPDVADRILASFPLFSNKLLLQRMVQAIAEKDKDILDGLHKVGFRTNLGIDGTGVRLLATSKTAGGYYLDVGASQLIAEGKIKLKNDSPISRFTTHGLEFENGSTLDADVVVFATGYSDTREAYRAIFGDDVGNRLKPIWGFDAEGEMNSCWVDSGVPRLYVMMGNFALCRFHSKHLALQIKAMEEELWDGTRYSRDD